METVTVNATALRSLLQALNGPGHLIRELQVTRETPGREGLFADNPIDTLIREFNEQVTASASAPAAANDDLPPAVSAALAAFTELMAVRALKARVTELDDPMNWKDPPELAPLREEYERRAPLAWAAAEIAFKDLAPAPATAAPGVAP